MTRFAFVISDLYGGGAQKVLLNTADSLREKGHQVRVFTLRNKVEHDIPEELVIENLAVINKVTKALSNVVIERLQARRIREALLAYAPDVTISCSCDKITRHINDLNIYYWVHANSIEGAKTDKLRNKRIRKVKRFYTKKKLIAVSGGIRDSLVASAGLDPKDIEVIYNPFNQGVLCRLAKEPLPEPQPSEYFIHVGTFEIRKRHDRLIRAYHESGIATPLVIMGKGSDEERRAIADLIQQLGLEKQVHILPFQRNPYPWIAKAKALLLTSDQEGLPTVLIEALLLHVPIISTDCPSGPREILTGELADFLVAPEDEKGLAEAIARMDRAPVTIDERHYRRFLTESVIPQFEAL
ncbi:glycosyltransferase [Halomonas sp. PBN3]|uniref:glycosyltransferase n=1 Tax=Halomonas sp. PBN3 TaxID=1397528 RepID=UPI0003B7E6B5|nr:glycosyltransferase [Halomonas sp. PBN3]ERS91447.1 hypothetical protein Q671_16535 [Halomonas sp. PBN3]